MNYLLYFLQLILIQYTSAQVITLGGRNFLNNQNCNLPASTNFANNALLTNIGQTAQIVTPVNNLGQEYLIANAYPNNILTSGNRAGGNIGLAAGNIAGGNVGLATGNIAGGNIGLATGNIASGNIGLASGNIASEVVYNNAVPMNANVVKPPREYGIEFSSGALSVGGNVEVNGRMPFNANVAFSGTVPAQGQGAVDYKCGQNEEES